MCVWNPYHSIELIKLTIQSTYKKSYKIVLNTKISLLIFVDCKTDKMIMIKGDVTLKIIKYYEIKYIIKIQVYIASMH